MKAIVGILSLLLVLGSMAVARAETTFQVFFNEPGFTNLKSDRLAMAFVDLVDQAPSGAELHMAIYDFEDLDVARALVAAVERGVRVRIVLDGANKKFKSKRGSAVWLLHQADRKMLYFCGKGLSVGACNGQIHMHNKFMLISELRDGSRDVVVQTSANLNPAQRKNFNDLLVIRGNASLYRGMSKYWRDLRGQGLRKVDSPVKGDGGNIQAYLFPTLDKDPVLKDLKRLQCVRGRSRVRVLQSRFDDDRIEIAEQLAKMARQGCDVRVMVREEPDHSSPGRRVRSVLGDLMIVLDYKGDEKRFNSTHAKILLLEGPFRGFEGDQKVVMTGSHNLNLTSLRLNDEVLLRIFSPRLYDVYLAAWQRLLSASQN